MSTDMDILAVYALVIGFTAWILWPWISPYLSLLGPVLGLLG